MRNLEVNRSHRWRKRTAWLLIAALLGAFLPTVFLPPEAAHAAARRRAASHACLPAAASNLPACCCPLGQCRMAHCSQFPAASRSSQDKPEQTGCRADCGSPSALLVTATALSLRALPVGARASLPGFAAAFLLPSTGASPLTARSLSPPDRPPRSW